MIPALKISYWYLLYFLPFVFIFKLFFVPIPVAIVYEAFKVT
jgi:hypothetical protein